MKVLKVNLSRFEESGDRLDANYHLSDGPLTKLQLEKSPYPETTLERVTEDIFSGSIFKRTYVDSEEVGYPYLTGSDMMKSDINSRKFISKKYTKQAEKLMIHPGWILVTCSGTLGNTAFTNELYNGRVATHDLIRIIPTGETVKPGFLYAYLTSKYGNALLTQSSYGGVVKHIEPHHITKLPIPVFPQEKQQQIHDLIMQASQLRVEANEKLVSAEEKFNANLKIETDTLKSLNDPLERSISNQYTISNKNITAHTFRARNYSQRKSSIIQLLQSSSFDELGSVLLMNPFYGSRYKRIESSSKSSIELLSQGNLFDRIPNGRFISKRSIRNLEDEIVNQGTILIPAQGTLGENEIFGRAQFVWGYLEDKLVAGHAMRFIPDTKKISAGYLFCVLRSPLWMRLLRNSVYGTNLLGFIVPLISKLPIPRLKADIEQIIDISVKNAYNALTKANELENVAIHLVEKEIAKWDK